MFEHIRNWMPWNERAKRKADFVKKLREPHQGKLKVRFKNIGSAPIGTTIMVSNYRTGDIMSAVLLSADSWAIYGTNVTGDLVTKSSVDLEDFLTDMRVLATSEGELAFNDPTQCLDVNYNGR